MKRALLLLLLAVSAAAEEGPELSLTVLPNAAVRLHSEGKVIPQSYVDGFGGDSAPVYRLERRQKWSREGYWGLSLLHTGVFGGGKYAPESIPDLAGGGTHQTDQLNAGFTNVQLTYRRPLAAFPRIEALAEMSVDREIFKRKDFVVKDLSGTGTVSGGGMDDVNEISAEGLGFGLAGRHGGRLYGRWEVVASHLIQIFDAKTDAAAGQTFRAEASLGAQLGRGFSLEAGGLWYYWFTFGQGDRRLYIPGSQGAVISWNRQETRASGLFLSLRKTLSLP